MTSHGVPSDSYSDEPLYSHSLPDSDGASDEDTLQPQAKRVRRRLFPRASLSIDYIDFSQKVSIPEKVLESIWKKAFQLLSTSNAIAVAPGLDLKSHTVISTSGNRPHLVLARKLGNTYATKPVATGTH